MNSSSSPIFIIEDDPLDVQLITDALTALEIECPVIVCETGVEAIAKLQVFTDDVPSHPLAFPRAILVDLNLPGIDGFALIRWIRQQRRLANVFVAVVSGSADPADPMRAHECGADEFIRKPTTRSELKALLAAALPANPPPRASRK